MACYESVIVPHFCCFSYLFFRYLELIFDLGRRYIDVGLWLEGLIYCSVCFRLASLNFPFFKLGDLSFDTTL